jgi:hypothetical protein
VGSERIDVRYKDVVSYNLLGNEKENENKRMDLARYLYRQRHHESLISQLAWAARKKK